MYVTVRDNDGFEDQLTQYNQRKVDGRSVYKVKELEGDSILIKNDQDQERWYGLSSKFKIAMV